MSSRKRKGMLIKNTHGRSIRIKMTGRTINLSPGETQLITAEEVLDDNLRAHLQVRDVSIVRPAQDDEEEELRRQLGKADK